MSPPAGMMTATAMVPRPKIRVISGVMATRGTERSIKATGMKVSSTGRWSANTQETARARAIPAT